MKKYLILIFLLISSQVYAECNRQDLSIWTYNAQINSASYNAGNNSISVTVAYNLASTRYKQSSLCGGAGNFDSFHSRHTVIIGSNESSPQYVVANKNMPATLTFSVSANGLDRNALVNGGYAITPSSYYDNGYSTSHSGNYSYFTPYNGSSSMIANMGPIYSYTTTQDQAAGCPADRPSGYILQRRTYEVWSDGSARNFGGWYNVADYCSVAYSYTATQDQAVSCPAERPSGHIVQRRSYEVWSDGSVRNYSNWYNVADYCSAVFVRSAIESTTYQCAPIDSKGRITSSGTYINYRNYEVWSDGSLKNYSNPYNVADYCAVRGTETQNVACPSTLPSGTITQSRTFEYYTTTAYSYGGQKFNYTNWTTIGNTCAAIYVSTETQSQSLACAAPYAEGGNGINQKRSREIWSNGPKDWNAWATVSTTCYKTVADVKDNSRKTCGEGQTGYRITEWRRTHKEFSTNSGKTPAEIATLNEQNATVWTEVEVANTCANIPDQVVKTETATRILSCGSVYKGVESSYTGEVIETGKKVYTYNSGNKQTTTTFVSNTPPTYNSTCKTSLSDIATEMKTEACNTGETGNKNYYRYITTNSDNTKETGAWILLTNNCQSTASSNDISQEAEVSQSKGLLSNNSVVSSSLSSETKLKDFIKSLNKSELGSESYRLNLIIDDLSTGKYNIINVSDTVAEFQKASPNSIVRVSIPKLVNQYTGNADITKNSAKDKIIISSQLQSDGNVLVKYKNLDNGISTSKIKSFKIKAFNSNVNMSKISY